MRITEIQSLNETFRVGDVVKSKRRDDYLVKDGLYKISHIVDVSTSYKDLDIMFVLESFERVDGPGVHQFTSFFNPTHFVGVDSVVQDLYYKKGRDALRTKEIKNNLKKQIEDLQKKIGGNRNK